MFYERLMIMKRFISGVTVGLLISSTIAFAATYTAHQAGFKVLVNGKEFTSDPPPLVVEGRTYLPLRAMGDALGVPVEWNAELKQAEVGTTIPVAEQKTYSRTNPAPIGTSQTYTKTSDWLETDNYTVNISVQEVIRGEKAWQKIKDANMFNSPAKDGYEYILVKIGFTVMNTKSDFSIDANSYGFTAFSSTNEEMEYASVVEPDPELSASLYEGASTEGYITVQVKKDDPNPKLAYGLDYNGSNGIWFSLN